MFDVIQLIAVISGRCFSYISARIMRKARALNSDELGAILDYVILCR
jgi:hypothetical protein